MSTGSVRLKKKRENGVHKIFQGVFEGAEGAGVLGFVFDIASVSGYSLVWRLL